MEDLINQEILENISENYQIYKVLNYSVGKKYFEIRERSCFADQDLKLVRHNNMSFFPTREDAEKALSEIVQKRFEEQSQ